MAVATQRVVRKMMPTSVLIEKAVEKKKLNVAAYARVSTDKDEQEDSFARQVEYYTGFIKGNNTWNFVGIYADPGITGTKADARPDFMRMINDCREGKIDRILVKSLSRFARNTIDALMYIRELREKNIGITFESENIDTLTPGGEVLLTILAAMAEQESRTISKNVKWSYQKKFESGIVSLNTGLLWGYNKVGVDEDGGGIYEINEEEAEIVRRIYREYIGGLTPRQIAANLERDEIKTKLGKTKWRYSVIQSILTNEKYTGNAILGKTFKMDVTSAKRCKNEGQAPQYYVESTHPAIIDMETFERVQNEMKYRSSGDEDTVGQQKYSSRYAFSGMLVCGKCGSRYRRHSRKMGSGKMVASWACANKIVNGADACHSRHIREDILIKTYIAAMKKMSGDYNKVIATLQESADVLSKEYPIENLNEISDKIITIQTAVMKLHRKKQQGKIDINKYDQEIEKLQKELQENETKQNELQQASTKISHIKDRMKEFGKHMETTKMDGKYDGVLLKKLVNKIKMYDDRIVVEFNYGITVEQEYVE